MSRPFCAAHRGLSSVFPENTLAALQAAVETGFPALEIDVRRTRDGEVVLLHDAAIERTTNGTGRVADMSYDELRSYDTGQGPVPRFDDVLAVLDVWRGLWDIEVKSLDATGPAIDLAEHHGLGQRAHLSSMDPRVLRVARDTAESMPRGLIVLGPPDEEDQDEARANDCAWLHCDEGFLSPDLVDQMHDHGLRVGAWTVNDPRRAVELAEAGVECIITDVAEVLREMAGNAEPEPWF